MVWQEQWGTVKAGTDLGNAGNFCPGLLIENAICWFAYHSWSYLSMSHMPHTIVFIVLSSLKVIFPGKYLHPTAGAQNISIDFECVYTTYRGKAF